MPSLSAVCQCRIAAKDPLGQGCVRPVLAQRRAATIVVTDKRDQAEKGEHDGPGRAEAEDLAESQPAKRRIMYDRSCTFICHHITMTSVSPLGTLRADKAAIW